MTKFNLLRKFLLILVIPIASITLFYIFRLNFLDSKIDLQAYSFTSIFIVVFAAIGGLYSGLVTTIYATLLGIIFYTLPQNPQGLTEQSTERILAFLFTGVTLSLFVSMFSNNRKHLKKATIGLNNTSNRLKKIMDNLFTIIAIIDKHGNIKDISKSYSGTLKLNNEEKIVNIFDVPPWSNDIDLKQKLKDSIEKLTSEAPIKFEHAIEIDNKSTYSEIELNCVPIGKTEEIVITVRDITDKRKYEAELIRSKEILSRLIDANIIGMTVADLNGEFIETNDSFLEMIGHTPEEFIENGINWQKITPEDFRVIDEQKIEELKQKGYMSVFEKEYYHKDGHKVSLMLAGVMINESQVLCLMLDLTPQKKLQQQKDEFISIASHELKTPMTVIKGYLQLLSQKLSTESEGSKEFLKVIDFQLNKMNTLVNELHDMSKIESNKLRMHFSTVNLNELVSDSIKEVYPFIDKHKIKLIEKQKNITINADLIRLEQVLINLLTNAIKYSPANGSILVTVDKNSQHAIISVKDFGLGIPEDKIKNIFSKFFQVEEASELKEGLGLGLYISSQIINQHKGSITVESIENQGSTFTVKLPLN